MTSKILCLSSFNQGHQPRICCAVKDIMLLGCCKTDHCCCLCSPFMFQCDSKRGLGALGVDGPRHLAKGRQQNRCMGLRRNLVYFSHEHQVRKRKKRSWISMRRSSVFLRNVQLCKSVPLFLAQIAIANYIAYQMWVFGLRGEATAGTCSLCCLFPVGNLG